MGLAPEISASMGQPSRKFHTFLLTGKAGKESLLLLDGVRLTDGGKLYSIRRGTSIQPYGKVKLYIRMARSV